MWALNAFLKRNVLLGKRGRFSFFLGVYHLEQKILLVNRVKKLMKSWDNEFSKKSHPVRVRG